MDNLKKCNIGRYFILLLEGKWRSRIKERLSVIYGDPSPSVATVKNLCNKFERCRTSIFDDPRPGLLLADRRLKLCELAKVKTS